MAEPVPFNPSCPSCVSLARQVAELTILVKQLQATVEKQGKELARLKAKSKPGWSSQRVSPPLVANENGFSLHAATRVTSHFRRG